MQIHLLNKETAKLYEHIKHNLSNQNWEEYGIGGDIKSGFVDWRDGFKMK